MEKSHNDDDKNEIPAWQFLVRPVTLDGTMLSIVTGANASVWGY